MIIEGFGIILRSLKHDEIEMVRQWRNSDSIRNNMIYRLHITQEEQESWFANLEAANNIYQVIFDQEEAVGLLNCKNIDWERSTGEIGIFIGDEKRRNSPLPLRAIYTFINYLFSFHGFEELQMKIRKDNKASLNYCTSFGSKIVSELNKDIWLLNLTLSDYQYISEKPRTKYARRYGHKPDGLSKLSPESEQDSLLIAKSSFKMPKTSNN